MLRWLGPLVIATAGCGTSGLEGLQGSWAGQIICCVEPSGVPPSCRGDTSEIALGLLVERDQIYGDSQIRTKGSNSNFQVTGSQSTVGRLVDCADTPTCGQDADCYSVLDLNGQTASSRCQQGFCSPCFERAQQPLVLITLRHQTPGLQFPELELWRFGDSLMEGTIKGYCPSDEPSPRVSVTKRWQSETP
jgi:hypothetical protein